MSFMSDCHLRSESTAAGLVLPNDGWGCLTGQKPTSIDYQLIIGWGSGSLFVSGLLRNTFALHQEFVSYRVWIPPSNKCYLFYLALSGAHKISPFSLSSLNSTTLCFHSLCGWCLLKPSFTPRAEIWINICRVDYEPAPWCASDGKAFFREPI